MMGLINIGWVRWFHGSLLARVDVQMVWWWSGEIPAVSALQDDHCQFFLYQILRGMKYVHSAQVLKVSDQALGGMGSRISLKKYITIINTIIYDHHTWSLHDHYMIIIWSSRIVNQNNQMVCRWSTVIWNRGICWWTATAGTQGPGHHSFLGCFL